MTPEEHKLIIRIEAGIIIVLLLFCGIATYEWKKSKADCESLNSYSASLSDSIIHLKNGVVQKTAVTVTQVAFDDIVKQNADLSKELALEKIKSKNVKGVTEVSNSISFVPKPLIITLHDTIPCPEFKPIPFNVDSAYYSIGGVVSKESVVISKLSARDSEYIITSTTNHLFKADELNVTVRHTNPHIKTIGLESLTVKESKKWYQGKWIPVIAGLAGGYLLFHK